MGDAVSFFQEGSYSHLFYSFIGSSRVYFSCTGKSESGLISISSDCFFFFLFIVNKVGTRLFTIKRLFAFFSFLYGSIFTILKNKPPVGIAPTTCRLQVCRNSYYATGANEMSRSSDQRNTFQFL